MNQNIKLETIGPNVTKKCKICKEEKSITNFAKNGTWFRPECKQCSNLRQKEYIKFRKEQRTPDEGKVCECCGNDVVPLVWDHDHISMEHRGWLCHNCNTAIGKLGDNLEGVLNAATYLAKAYKI